MNKMFKTHPSLSTKNILRRHKKILRIRMHHSQGDFFHHVLSVLNQLIYCEKHHFFPVVFFGSQVVDCENPFHSPTHGENAWDNYFEPVAGLNYFDILNRIDDPEDPLRDDDIIELGIPDLWSLNSNNPDSIYSFPHGIHYNITVEKLQKWCNDQQRKAQSIVQKFIKPQTHILQTVELFWQTQFANNEVLGLFLNSTSDLSTIARPSLGRVINLQEYYPYIDQFFRASPNGKVLAVSDDLTLINEIQKQYPDGIVPGYLSESSSDFIVSNLLDADPYRAGEINLVNCLLLSRTDLMIGCDSAGSEFPIYFNPDLVYINLNTDPLVEVVKSKKSHNKAFNPLSALNFLTLKKSTELEVHNSALSDYYFGHGQLFEGAILINLDSRQDKYEKSLHELQTIGLGERIVRMSAYRHENKSYACSRSHVEAIRYARVRKWKSVIIFEDDIHIQPSFHATAYHCFDALRKIEWGLFQFGAMNPDMSESVGTHLFRHRSGHATQAYALHESTYDYIIDHYVCDPGFSDIDQSRHVPIDEYLNNYFTRQFPSFGSKQLLISQKPGISDIQGTYIDYRSVIEDVYALKNANNEQI